MAVIDIKLENVVMKLNLKWKIKKHDKHKNKSKESVHGTGQDGHSEENKTAAGTARLHSQK